jgi:hypothetical protein
LVLFSEFEVFVVDDADDEAAAAAPLCADFI